MGVTVHHGDMRDVLAQMAADGVRVQSIVTDPPYHLTTNKKGGTGIASLNVNSPAGRSRISTGFMGKAWDGGDIAFRPETWRLCWDLLPPGGWLLAFAGTRTHHRMACAIEDAGFEIRDMIAWLYGSGFPKSHNVGKAIDRAAGVEREVVGVKPGHEQFVGRTTRGHIDFKGATEGFDRPWMHDDEARSRYHMQTAPATDAARQWEGWGTALKPALEPICVARKPLIGTVAANVLAHGTGALNIEACRIEGEVPSVPQPALRPNGRDKGHALGAGEGRNGTMSQAAGRWPANVAHDGSAEVERAFPDSESSRSVVTSKPGSVSVNGAGLPSHTGEYGFNDSGSAARFFYSSKADADDRLRSRHPTVKPVDLMRWLVRLVTPPGGTVLDPFAGSGTTGMACMAEGFDAILVEREAEYVADIRRRIAHVSGEDTPLFAMVAA